MVKIVNKMTAEQYEGAEKLADKLVAYLDYELKKPTPKADYTLWAIRNATFDCFKSVIKCELLQMLAEVDNELNDMGEYYKNNQIEP